MRKTLFAGMLTGVMLVGSTSVMPAQAGQKGAFLYVIKGGAFSGDPYGTDTKENKGCGDGTAKNYCAPWVNLPGWPVNNGIAKGVGGHFHKQYRHNKFIEEIWDQKVSLIAGDAKETTKIHYDKPGGTCGHGQASGTLVLAYSEETPFIIKGHDTDVKGTAHYEFIFRKAGNLAILIAINQKKTADVIVATLILHPKESAQKTLFRCLGFGTHDPFKVSFDITGIAVGS